MSEHKQYAHSSRRDYSVDALEETHLMPNPIDLFDYWFNESVDKQVVDANAMTVASVDEFNHPFIRVVLMRDYTSDGFTFFTNYSSLKGQHFDKNRNVCAHFFWKELGRQVRIQGTIEKIDTHLSDDYFHSRPRENQVAALASPQSEVVPNRDFLMDKYYKLLQDFENKNVPRPENWGGYLINPHSIEFWQGRLSRLHDRFVYTLQENGSWKIERLAP